VWRVEQSSEKAEAATLQSRRTTLEPNQRAALIPNEPGVHWHHFLGGRFIGPAPHIAKNTSLAITVQIIEQQSQTNAVLRGLVELYAGSSLPVVSEFVAELNLETREISIRQSRPDRRYVGQFRKMDACSFSG
jgi:hypothetical protein